MALQGRIWYPLGKGQHNILLGDECGPPPAAEGLESSPAFLDGRRWSWLLWSIGLGCVRLGLRVSISLGYMEEMVDIDAKVLGPAGMEEIWAGTEQWGE